MAYRYKTVKRGGKTVLLHRWLMEQHLGRALVAGEQVHHRNGNRQDNRIENLQLVIDTEHAAHHADERLVHPRTKNCEVCGSPFTPHATKRKRQKTCSRPCRDALIATTERETKARLRAGRAA